MRRMKAECTGLLDTDHLSSPVHGAFRGSGISSPVTVIPCQALADAEETFVCV